MLPKIEIPRFSGETMSDTMNYYSFKSTFDDIVTNKKEISNSVKLVYLKNSFHGYSGKILQHLATNNDNFKVACDLLDKELFNKDAVADQLFAKLLKFYPKRDRESHNFLNIKIYFLKSN